VRAPAHARTGIMAARFSRRLKRHSNSAIQGFVIVREPHHFGELGLDLPRFRLRRTKAAAEFDRRDAFLGLRDPIHGAEPSCQRCFGRVEDRACRDRSLAAASVALEQLARADDAVSAASALRTHKSVRPAPHGNERAALILIAIRCLKTSLREALLNLDAIACHGQPLRSAQTFADHKRAMKA